MYRDFLERHWINDQSNDMDAIISAWDSVAADYVHKDGNSFSQNTFLRWMDEKIGLSPDMTVLDVGCGAGAYAVELAQKVGHVDGIDFSPEMIRLAKEYVKRHGLTNVRFLERDWYQCDIVEFEGKYDVVMAHTTPAVASYETLMKLHRASRKYGVLCMPTRRSDKILDALRTIVEAPPAAKDPVGAHIFAALWDVGAEPEITYEKTVWRVAKPLDEALVWYRGRLRSFCAADQTKEKAAMDYLRQIAEDGYVRDEIHTTLVNCFWKIP